MTELVPDRFGPRLELTRFIRSVLTLRGPGRTRLLAVASLTLPGTRTSIDSPLLRKRLGSPTTQRITAEVASAGKARQQLLFLARPQIPAILWVVVWRTTLIAVIVVMTLEVASLAVLDRPFSPIARIQPTAMTDAIGLLTAGRTDLPTSHDCVLLAGR